MTLFAATLVLAASAGAAPGFVVAIDPGHGGPFPHEGAHGPRRLYEKNVTLAIARELAHIIEGDLGGRAVLTRAGDVDVALAERPAIANAQNADFLISIHCNSMPTTSDRRSTRGIETYSLSPDPTDAQARVLADRENADPAQPAATKRDPVQAILEDLAVNQAHVDSTALAAALQRRLIRATHAPSRGVRQAPFIVLAGARMPAALVEVGFISHPAEGRRLAQPHYQRLLAQAIADGIADFRKEAAEQREAHGPAAPTAAARGAAAPSVQ